MIYLGDCLEVMQTFEDNTYDAIITDPPYALTSGKNAKSGFMGKEWDSCIPGIPYWQEALRVAKPGAHLLAFGGDRTHHRLMVAIEDAGWELRTCIYWVFASGFPKSRNISRAIDQRGGKSVGWFGPWLRSWREENKVSQKQIAALFPSKTGGMTGCVANWELGLNLPTPEQFNLIRDKFKLPFESIEEAEREIIGHNDRPPGWFTNGEGHDITIPATEAAKQWDGWGTALKPAVEIVVMARKPLEGNVAENVLRWGCGGLNIDECRIEMKSTDIDKSRNNWKPQGNDRGNGLYNYEKSMTEINDKGRWPANLILDEGSANLLDDQSGVLTSGKPCGTRKADYRFQRGKERGTELTGFGDSGGASRFFFCAKASTEERNAGLQRFTEGVVDDGRHTPNDTPFQRGKTKRKNQHPTIKPIELMKYLCRLVTPPKGCILDPFMGSGSTVIAGNLEGFTVDGIEIDPKSFEWAEARIKWHGKQVKL